MQLLLAGAQKAKDVFFNYVSLLLSGNGANGAQNNTFLDSSTNNFTITRNGNTTQGTFSPFSQTGWSGLFVRSSSQFCTVSNAGGQFSFGTGAFTIEFWVNLNSLPTTTGYPAGFWFFGGGLVNSNTGIDFYIDNTQIGFNLTNFTSPTAIGNHGMSVGNWYHVVVVRGGPSNQTVSIYINGTRVATASSVTASSDAAATGIAISAAEPSGATQGNVDGYLSDYRIVKGTAVYDPTSTSLTIPKEKLTNISGTSLLTFQDNRFIDNSSNGFTINTSDSPSIQAFSPFNPTAAWSAATNGGSGYFDGSGDWITTPNVSAFDLSNSSTDFTIEAWVYNTGGGSFRGIIGARQDGQAQGWCLYIHSNNTLYMGSVIVGNSYADRQMNTTVIPPNTWAHVALVKTSSGYTAYTNGIAGTLLALTGGLQYQSTQPVIVGALGSQGEFPFLGFISNVRIVKGTAVYTTSFTPPTAPFTAITNTSYLLNFTNAGIYDATAKNDLETLGNAQISTTQSKFGGSSMYFDGNGDYLSFPSKQNFDFNTGNFTIEAWVYVVSLPAVYWPIIEGRTTSSFQSYTLGLYNISGTLRLDSVYSTTRITGTTTSVSVGVWTHVAITRSNGTVRLFVNGVADSTTASYSSAWNATRSNPLIGAVIDPIYANGYINDLRITKGVARYTATFTPPTAAFPIQ
jgi:hypothetical protein